MSRLVSRILLAVLMIPAATIVFIANLALVPHFFAGPRYQGTNRPDIWVNGLITWAFMAIYWFLLWRSSTQWTPRRQVHTFLAFVGSTLIGVFAGIMLNAIEYNFGDVMGSLIAPVSWLICVTLLWRETPAERAERIRVMDKTALVCPSCGYNLTGLQGTRCPECGTLYTLNELIAAQPSRAEDITE